MAPGPLGIVHPFPTTLVAAATAALGLLAGGTTGEVLTLLVAMAGFQASIGAVNDLADREHDRTAQPWKPLPAGRVSVRAARSIAVAGGVIGLGGSALLGPGALVVGLLGYGLGLAYDAGAARAEWGWLCLALALPLVPIYAWLGVGAGWPPQTWQLLLLGAAAGTELALANGLVDVEADGASGGRGLVVRLGRRRAGRAGIVLAVVVVGLAWLSVVGLAWLSVVGLAWLSLPGSGTSAGSAARGPGLLAWMTVASLLLIVGAVASARSDARSVRLGWHLQAVGVALTGLGWVAAAGG